MRCSKAQILLSASIDGETSGQEDLALKRHLAECAACAEFSSEIAGVHQRMALWEDEEPSPWLAQSFSYKLADLRREPSSPAPRRRAGWVWGAASAGLATAVIAFGLIMQSRIVPPTPTIVHVPPTVPMVAAQPVPEPVGKAVPVKPVYAAPMTRVRIAMMPGRTWSHRHYRRPVSFGSSWKRLPSGSYAVASNVTSPPDVPMVSMANGISSRDGEHLKRASLGIEMALARAAGEDPAGRVAQKLADAHLLVNERYERVCGTLQKAADLLASKHRSENKTMTDPVEGSIQ